MNRRFATPTLITALVLACVCLATAAFAQDDAASKPRARYLAIPPHSYYTVQPSSNQLTQWIYKFTYKGGTYTPTIVGTDPRSTNVTTTTPVFIVPIKMVFGKSNGNKTYDPLKNKFPGQKVSVLQTILNSPIFEGIDFKQGGVDLGKTQYEDAYERGSFWKYVSKNNKYHVLLAKPTVLPEQTIHVTPSEGFVGSNPFGGGLVGYFDPNLMDQLIQGYMQKFKQIQPNSLPLFITYETYLSCGSGCAIGGYHSANAGQPGGQTYSFTTTIDPGHFAEDTNALSHEFGEWLLDPFVDNNSPCGIMENGDPLETEPNYGAFPYTSHGFTYHLQDLVFINYFGAPKNTSLKGWYTFQNEFISAPCSRGSE
jgi:hypothetical protein